MSAMTDQNRKKACGIAALLVVCCAIMAFLETVVEPPYPVKSALKVVVFLFLPLIYARVTHSDFFDKAFSLDRKVAAKLLLLGVLIYAFIMGAYALTKNIFDYAALVQSLSADQKVDGSSFIGVALYISFCNSFLEEFLFRLVAFIQLSRYAPGKTAYLFSSVLFAAYHIAMLGTSFPPVLLLLALVGLAIGGLIFDYVDDRSGTIYNSWIIHMFADFAIMTIWYLHL